MALAAMAADARSSSRDPVVRVGVNVGTVRRLCEPVVQEHKICINLVSGEHPVPDNFDCARGSP